MKLSALVMKGIERAAEPGKAVRPPVAKAAGEAEASQAKAPIDRPEWAGKLFDYIRETTALAQSSEVAERVKAARAVSEVTAKKYARGAANRLDLGQKDGGDLLAGVSSRSFHAIKAAILHSAALSYADARKACDVAQRAGDWDEAKAQAIRARRALTAYTTAKDAPRPPVTTPSASKRKTLPRNEAWQKTAFEAATPAQKPALALLWAAGPRPAELEKGVDVTRVVHLGKVAIRVTIPGVKISEALQSGQPVRQLIIDAESEAGRALLSVMGNEKSMLIQRGASRIRKDFAEIRDRTMLRVSPYSMRHQASANAKAILPPETVAAMMGHQSERSQGRYGSKAQAQKGGGAVLDARAKLPVRPKAAPGEGPRKATTGPKAPAP